MDAISEFLGFKADPRDLTILQVSLRAIIIFVVCIVMVRVGHKRFLSKKSALDAVVGFILASMMARAVNGSTAFVPAIVGGFVIVLLHRFIGWCAMRSHRFGNLVKGTSDILVEDGILHPETLKRNNISENDMLEDFRINGGVSSPDQVKFSCVERNGEVSVVRK
jgi:uncharacterized membrane protein YcaP (DUF421 family)